jgi:hypothetical protein
MLPLIPLIIGAGAGLLFGGSKKKYAQGGNTLPTVKVKFKDPKYNYETSVGSNVTESDARKYFVGKKFDMGIFPKENMQTVVDIEFYPLGYSKMSFDDFKETLQEYELEGGFGKTVERGYIMYYLPSDHPYFNTKFKHRDIKKAYQEYLKFEKGGDVVNENLLMVANNNKQIAHHSEELSDILKTTEHVPAWVVAKVNRSASDLSDATHYLDGRNEFSIGGQIGLFQDIRGFENGGEIPKHKSLKHFILNEASSGMIANKIPYSDYKTTDNIRITAVQILNRDGDREYTMRSFADLIQEALLEYEENKQELNYAKGGEVSDYKRMYYLFQGTDHKNNKPLYRVESTSHNPNEYVGEWHTNKKDALSELKGLDPLLGLNLVYKI